MIKIENIYKSFGENEVLKGIDLTFERGQTNLIIGKSGAGKTVLLKILVGLLKPDKGTIMYGDVDFLKLGKKELSALRKMTGMLFQGSALFDSMTVQQNVSFPLDMFTNMTAKEKRLRIDECLERVDLEGINKSYPSEISGGMQKRVGIARAIVMKPHYLFCDEPNSGLDPTSSLLIDKLIREITVENQITTVINTHDMSSVMEIGDKIALLQMGHLVWVGNKNEVLDHENEDLQSFIFASPFLQRLKNKAMRNEG